MATKLRGAKDYAVGLDLGTGSVGWAVVDSNGELCRFKGDPTWGARLYETAKTAADARKFRSQRRRYDRRKRRLWRLQEMVRPDMETVDPTFFDKMEESFLHREDARFADRYDAFLTKEQRAKYKTIYHVRKELVENPNKADIRLVYLALHHLVKYRGHFLDDSSDLKASNADARASIEALGEAIAEYYGAVLGKHVDFDDETILGISAAVEDRARRRQERREAAARQFEIAGLGKPAAKELSKAVFGYEADFAKAMHLPEGATAKFTLDNEQSVREFLDSGVLATEAEIAFFDAIRAAYGSYLLAGILEGNLGLSGSMVASYERHHADLEELKRFVRKHRPDAYKSFFRGDLEDNGAYVKKKHRGKKDPTGYTAYILNAVDYEEFVKKHLKKLFDVAVLDEKDSKQWTRILDRADDGTYLEKQRTRDNGAIPHQLHLEELHAILVNQGRYWPTLAEHGKAIENLLRFRLPYYAGPLGTEKNPQRRKGFGWAVRREGQEGVPVLSKEDFERVYDVDRTAELFIERLTGECTYWYGKKVVPRNSLLYDEFTVRNELNKCGLILSGERGGRPKALSPEIADDIVENVFKRRRLVRVKDVLEYLRDNDHYDADELIGTQKEGEFASALNGYHDFRKLLGRPIESRADVEMVEELIRWATVFEDREIRKRKIQTKYGDVFDAETIRKIARRHYTGWGNLSREFLTELRAEHEGEMVSIMDVLRDPRGERPMNLREILADTRFGFEKLLGVENAEYRAAMDDFDLDEIPGSPAIKRTIRQAIKVVDEIVDIARDGRGPDSGYPAKICIEIAREDEGRNAGSRTVSRKNRLTKLYAAIKNNPDLYDEKVAKELKGDGRLGDRRFFLYYLQLGKCMYTGEALDLNRLSEYHIDHVIPRSLVKDDSFDNVVLVKRKENVRKLDEYPLEVGLQRKNAERWKALKDAGLLSERKYRSLTRSGNLSDRDIRGFINRQLVETRQIAKHVVRILENRYGSHGVVVETVKAGMTAGLRSAYGLWKSRELNDYHHAHDAFLATQVSRFLSIRYPSLAADLEHSSHSFKAEIQTASLKKSAGGRGKHPFLVEKFGETGEVWDGAAELGRLRKCLAWKQCFISRKVERQTGMFWNQKPVSRWTARDSLVPLRKGPGGQSLVPGRYGGYSQVNSAFYVVVEHRKGGKLVRKLESVPIHVANTLGGEQDLAGWIACQYAQGVVLSAPICKFQKIRWEGVEYYLVSSKEIVNARQLWIPWHLQEVVARRDIEGLDGERMTRLDTAAGELYEFLIRRIREDYPRLARKFGAKLDSDEARSCFADADFRKKQEILRQELMVLHADSSFSQLTVPVRASGRMCNVNVFSSGDLVFVHTSVTGMLESESRVVTT